VKTHPLFTLATVALLASCGTASEKNTTSSSAQEFVPFSKRLGSGERNDPNSYKRGADGKLEIDNAKRSQFENRGEATIGGRKYQKKEYSTGDYARKSWWGNKDYDSKTYAGPTDGSRFQTNSRMNGQGAPESASQARVAGKYDTGNYTTDNAREAGNINRDDEVQAREVGRTYDEFQWDKTRNLSVGESRSILGR
jgi:hypothetical protein